jgi:predicted nucleotidyltransferase component of viral defense system
LISNVQKNRKERKSKKIDKSEKNLKDANARLREEVRQEKQKHQEALKKEAQYKNKIIKLEEEQLAKPKVVEKEVIKFIDRPYYQAVPVPISQSNSINSEFMSSLKSYFNKHNTKQTREKDEKK